MPISDLAYQIAKIIRRGTTKGPDNEPIYAETIIATAVPCRFDQGMARTLRNQISGSMRAEQVAGMLYIDSSVLGDDGNLLDVQFKDQVFIDNIGPYEIYDLNRVGGFTGFDHYELSIVDYRNR